MAEELTTDSSEGSESIDDWLVEPQGIDGALACVGAKLDESDGSSVGRIEAVLKDADDGAPSWLVVKLGHFGKRAAVPFDYAAPGIGHVWTPFTRETIRGAAGIDLSDGLDAAAERELAFHYGMPEGSGRHAAASGRGDEEPSSVVA